MTAIEWTSDQRHAIEDAGRNVVVSAAAGAGKTAVLAERCAFLVCDAPPPHRCGVDELLVVTFTDAAAAEMKSRIRNAIEARLHANPNDEYLRKQLALIETAHISTVHSFCLWMIRRWFNEAGIDPAWSVIEADDARILKSDTLEEVVAELYDAEDDRGQAFKEWVSVYGLGSDGPILSFTLRLADFLETLPAPDDWLARTRLASDHPVHLIDLVGALCEELAHQQAHTELAVGIEGPGAPGIAFYSGKFADHARQLSTWRDALSALKEALANDSVQREDAWNRFETIRAQIDAYQIHARGAPRISPNATAEELDRREAAKALFDELTGHFKKRIRQRFARFAQSEMIDGLTAVTPFLSALTDLVQTFRQRYREAKRRREVLDFGDFERYAFELLANGAVVQTIRKRFAHILVDEYQDINPLQDALLRRVSREEDPASPNNLFSVGDVKQSIYRFRGAEPAVFLNRILTCRRDAPLGAAFFLRDSFRSRETILDGINDLFSILMRSGLGGIEYDSDHALHRGRKDRWATEPTSIDVHILDTRLTADADEEGSDETPTVDPNDPAEWSRIEREAFLIAQEIRRIRAGGITTDDGGEPRLSEFAVLLRASAHTADAMARMLGRFGISAYSEARGTLFDALEIRDVRALLEVLDNAHQDIPLAAMLRSGVLGGAFSEDDLVSIRVMDRTAPFHQTVHRYADEGRNADLRARLGTIFGRLRRYRQAMRERPVAEVLWEIIEQSGYLAYAGGLADGAQRRANLLRFCEQARRFSAFKRQGLRGFLHFIESLEDEDRDLGAAPAAGQSMDAVRIMTIHAAKGLEFPIVFVADLGRRFNMSDARGRMILDRDYGIGLRVVDPDRMIEYPSVTHQLVAANIERTTRAEELRVLYVAMTRSKEKLILVGSASPAGVESRRRLCSAAAGSPSPLMIATAATPLDWIITALASLPEGRVNWSGGDAESARFRVNVYSGEAIKEWKLEALSDRGVTPLRTAVAKLETLPPEEPTSKDEAADAVAARVRFDYPHLAVSSVRATVAASEVKGEYDLLRDPDEQLRERADGIQPSSPKGTGHSRSTARRRGTVTHLVLQHMDLAAAGDRRALDVELDHLVDRAVLDEKDVELVDRPAIEWFFNTPLGEAIRRAGKAYRREFIFLATQPAARFDPTLDPSEEERVLVRGIVDGILELDDGLEVIDFKTDRVSADEVPRRAENYRQQMSLYAACITPLFAKPVKQCRLIFLHPRVIVPVISETSPHANDPAI